MNSKIILIAGSLMLFFRWASGQSLPINKGPFEPTDQSLKQYQYPKWFRDAKFGIWAHWGPQAVPRQGDWYARKMYEEGSPDYQYHVAHYGHPSKFGYKDIIPLWKAQKWNPDQLMALYKKAGARYFVSMGSHHDNFFLWNSKIHPWNAVNIGPHKDIVGLWQKAAREQGLYFGVSEHLARSYSWYQPSHRADTVGPMKGIPYDGNDPQYSDLYHTKAAPGDKGVYTTDQAWAQEWYNDVKELVDTYHPDLLYSDSPLPYDAFGRSMLADFYNGNLAFHKGQLTAIYNCKQPSAGKWVQDMERGIQDSISTYPWQTDTSIGDWFYKTGQEYKSSTDILRMLTDIVSKNGNLLINIVQTPEGDLEPDMIKTLAEIGTWMHANGEGIYGTRPWVVFGEKAPDAPLVKSSSFNEDKIKYTAADIRFTTKGNVLYAFCLDVPKGDIVIKSLGKVGALKKQIIASVSMLGTKGVLKWQQTNDKLIITKPANLPNWRVMGFKINLKSYENKNLKN